MSSAFSSTFGKVAKYTNVLLNAGFLLSGFLLIVVGAYAYSESLPGLSSQYIAVGLIVLGCIFAVISLLGFFGFLRENKRIVVTYLVIVCVFVVVEVALAITAYVRKDDFESVAYVGWQHLYYNDPKGIINIEESLACCGWYNVTDFPVPGDCSTAVGFGWLVGCRNAVDAVVESSYLAAGAIAVSLAVIQTVAVIFSCVAVRYFKPAQEREQELVEEEF